MELALPTHCTLSFAKKESRMIVRNAMNSIERFSSSSHVPNQSILREVNRRILDGIGLVNLLPSAICKKRKQQNDCQKCDEFTIKKILINSTYINKAS
jgi:hypothetical protein